MEGQRTVSLFSTLPSYSSNPSLLKDDSSLLPSPIIGSPLANTICMILVIIRMKVLAEKRKELCQTISLLIGALRKEKGCERCDFYRSMEDEHELCILEEWDTRENLNSHLKSEHFRVLRGAMSLLQGP